MEKLFPNARTLFNKLNNLDYTDQGLKDLRAFIESRYTVFPERINTALKRYR